MSRGRRRGSDPSPVTLRSAAHARCEGSDPLVLLFCSRLWAYIRRSSPGEGGGGAPRRQAPEPGYQSRIVMTDDVETRRRRAAYRACHRGTKEMDWILGPLRRGGAAGAWRRSGSACSSGCWRCPIPDLQDMILHPELAPAGEFAELVAAVRAFHGLEGAGMRQLYAARRHPGRQREAVSREPRQRAPARPPTLRLRTSGQRRRHEGDAGRRAGGLAPLVLARLAEEARAAAPPLLLHVARDDRRLEALAEGLAFLRPRCASSSCRPGTRCPTTASAPTPRSWPRASPPWPAWRRPRARAPTVVLTTVNAILQRVPPREFIRRSLKNIAPGQRIDMNELVQRLESRRLPAHRHRHGARRIRGARRHPRSLSAGALEPGAARFLRRHAGAHQGLRSRDAAHRQDRAEADPDAGQRGGVRRRGREALPPRLRRDVRPGARPRIRSTRRSAPASAIPAWSTGCRCSTSSWRRCSTTCRRRRSASTIWPRRRWASGWR